MHPTPTGDIASAKSAIYYSACKLLKQTLYKRHFKTLDGLQKFVVEKWDKINLGIEKFVKTFS